MNNSDPKTIHVVVLMGGPSGEHDISVQSGTAVASTLQNSGYQVTAITFDDNVLPPLPDTVDVVFPALHGEFGEDGQVQELLEVRKIPYVGSDSAASRIIIDKHRTKSILSESDISLAQWALLTSKDDPIPPNLRFPVIMKPNRGGSTLGMQLVESELEWQSALEKAYEFENEILAESFVRGTEVTVGLLNGEALPVVEIIPPGQIFDFDAKYKQMHGHTRYYCPPRNVKISTQIKIKEIAEHGYQLLGARDMLRVDMILYYVDSTPLILEANSIPGFTENSLLPKAAAASGISFDALCSQLVMMAVGRKHQ